MVTYYSHLCSYAHWAVTDSWGCGTHWSVLLRSPCREGPSAQLRGVHPSKSASAAELPQPVGGPHLVSDLMGIAAWPFQLNAEYSWATFSELSTGLAKTLSSLPHSSTSFSAHFCFLSLPSNRNWTLITPLPQTLSQHLLLNSTHFSSWLLLDSHVHMYMYMRFCSEIYLSPTWPWLV